MARFLVKTDAAVGHVMPTIPITRKLVERGHEIIWITGRNYKEKVESTGARFQPLQEEIDPGEMEWYDFCPQLKKLKGLAQIKWYLKHLDLDPCSLQIEIINKILKYFPADVFLGDQEAFALMFRSEMEGPPFAGISLLPVSLPSPETAPFGLGILPGENLVTKVRNKLLNFLTYSILLHDVTTYANNIRQELNLEPLNGHFFKAMWQKPSLILHISTPAFEYPRSNQLGNFYFIGPILPEPTHTFHLPDWWSDLNGSEPIVLVNQGTMGMSLDDLVIPAIKGLKNEKMLVVAVPVKQGQLRELPANVRAEPFIPFDHLLPHVDVMVTNGGYGGTQWALAQGIPLVVAGETEDKIEVAARVEWARAGINLRKQHPQPDEVRDAVKEVLINPIYRENARRIQTDFAKYDAPTRAAELLEALANGEL